MSIVVQKYGGSSVANVDKIREVARRIVATRELGHQVVVTVSAMGNTTDELISLAKAVSPTPSRRELDMLVTAGERISMALLSMAIHELGVDAVSLTGSQSGIITNDQHSDARIVEVRPFRIQDELARDRIVIVAGYQGVSYKREITTLGRGGTDTTAVALAAALDAQWCEICSDVDGVYSADPHDVPAARRLSELSFEEMQEMAEAGARVLHAQAVEFAKDKGIAIYARATSNAAPGAPDLSREGTIVRKQPPPSPGRVVGVVSERSLAVLHATCAPASWQRVLDALDTAGVRGKQIHAATGETDGRLTVVLRTDALADRIALEKALSAVTDDARIETGAGAVSLIGAGINDTHANMSTTLRELEAAGIGVLGLSTSSFRITVVVPEDDVTAAVTHLHRHFIESQPLPVP